MNDKTQDQQAAIQQRMDQLRVQFVNRTLGELAGVDDLLQRVRQGDAAALRDMELLAHKIHGTGATFGLVGISAHAGDIERMVASEKSPGGAMQFASDAERAERIAASLQRLQNELRMLAGN